MTCSEFADLVQQLLDERRVHPLPSHAITHAAACPVCRDLHHAAVALHHATQPQPALTPPADFAERVLGRWRAERRRAQTVWRCIAAAASIAFLGLGLWGATLLQRPDANSTSTPLAESKPAATPAMPSKPVHMVDASQATLDLGRTVAAKAWHDASVLLPPQGISAPPLDASRGPEVALPEVARSVNQGLEPVTQSAQRAWTAWTKLLPTPKEERKRS